MTDTYQKRENGLRICANCGDPFEGRSDKQYCGDTCRNAAKREKQKMENWKDPIYIEKVNQVLRQNRMILKETLGRMTPVSSAKWICRSRASISVNIPASSMCRIKSHIISAMNMAGYIPTMKKYSL